MSRARERSRVSTFGVLSLLMAAALVAASCGGDSDGDDESSAGDDGTNSSVTSDEIDLPTTTSTIIEEGPKAPFTGLAATDEIVAGPAVVVKVSNNDERSRAALTGLHRADVVIEERIEDRATRFAAIFHSDMPELVGPVRSARTTDLDLLANLGDPILIFSGANITVLGQLRDLAAENRVVLVVNDDSETYHYRSSEFSAPDNLFTDPALVATDFADRAGVPAPVVAFRDAETDTRPASVEGVGITVSGRDTVSFVHQPGSGYVRVQDGSIHTTRDGDALAVTNLVVMEVVYVQSTAAADSIDAITVGSGPAHVLINGRRWSGTWFRDNRDAGYRFEIDDGTEVLLEPGKTWVTLVPADAYELTVDAETSELVASTAG